MLHNVLMILHGFVAFGIITLVLLQQGKGADAGAAFGGGGGASQSVFGSQGSSSFLTTATAILATVFFITSLTLAYLAGSSREEVSITDHLELPIERATPSDIPVLPTDEKDNGSDVPEESAADDLVVPKKDAAPSDLSSLPELDKRRAIEDISDVPEVPSSMDAVPENNLPVK